MEKYGMWMKTTVWHDQRKEEECLEHVYQWVGIEPDYVYHGQLPKMGKYQCILCGRPNTDVPHEVICSEFGCRDCLWHDIECRYGSKYEPSAPYHGRPTCGCYMFYD